MSKKVGIKIEYIFKREIEVDEFDESNLDELKIEHDQLVLNFKDGTEKIIDLNNESYFNNTDFSNDDNRDKNNRTSVNLGQPFDVYMFEIDENGEWVYSKDLLMCME